MWLSLALLLMLLAVAYFHSIQGLFSSLLSAVLTILCVGLAFATFEYVAVAFLASFKPDCALGLSLVLMFAVPLLVLRLVLDRYVHRACVMPLLIDRAGALVFGVIASFLMVGMVALGLQLLPFGSGVLGFTRVDREDPSKPQAELWLKPDRFAAGVGTMLSGGLLSGARSFAQDHPDFVTEIGWVEAVLPTDSADRRGVRRFAPPGSMRVLHAYEEPVVYSKSDRREDEFSPFDEKEPEPGNKYVRVKLQLEGEAQDADNQHRFTLFQVRLVGDRGGDQPAQYHAIAAVDAEDPAKAVYQARGNSLLGALLKPDSYNQVDVVFEVPKGFVPRFAAYKSSARDAVTVGDRPGDPGAVASVTPDDGDASVAGEPRGRVSGLALRGSFFGEDLPEGLTMTAYRGADIEVNHAASALKQGHLYGIRDDQERQQHQAPFSKFDVPADKRLLHLSVEKLRAQSMLGKALGLAVTTVQNYIVTDDSGRQYRPVGAYILGMFSVYDYIEMQYFPEQSEFSSRSLRNWVKLTENRLRGDYTYVLLYLVEPGAKIVRFSTGGGASVTPIDLSEVDLTAPE
ncbi:MAG: hypothetical protein GY842_12650 [bacterium]|nr:hypothetical protein [bacterium]